MTLSSSTPLTRAQKVRLAAALLEKARRAEASSSQAASQAATPPTTPSKASHPQASAMPARARGEGSGPKPTLTEWTILHRANLVPNRLFDLEGHHYLLGLYGDQHQHIAVYKAGQMGASEWMIGDAIYSCDVREATVLYVFPTDTAVSDFSTARIGPAVEASPYLERIISSSPEDRAFQGGRQGSNQGGEQGPAPVRRRRGADRVTLKRVRNRFMYLRGAQVRGAQIGGTQGRAPQLRSIDADALYLDEIDEMDPAAIPLARERLGHSLLALKRDASTPTYPNVGIHAIWLESDQREWFIPCPACGRWQYLTIDHVVVEWDGLKRPVHWHGGPGDAWAACERCGARLNHRARGQWVARHPGREIHGYHLTRLFSHVAELSAIVEGLRTVDESKRKEIYNQALGEPYSPRGGRLTDEVLDGCRREYAHGVVPEERTYAGIDVGKLLNVVIRGQRDRETGEVPQRWAGEVETEAEMIRILKQYNVARCVMDALPETRMARRIQAAMPPGVVWLAYYGDGGSVGRKTEPLIWNEAEGTVTMDRTRTLDDTFADFMEGERTLPAYARDVPEYYKQMRALVRVVDKDARGNQVARYVHTDDDHFAHGENYERAAEQAPRYVPVSGEAVSRDEMRGMLG